MYMARSLLCNPLTVIIGQESSAATEMILEGRNKPIPLEAYESPETKYQLSFRMDDKLPASEPFLLSWGIIEQIRDKDYASPSIDEILEEMKDYSSKANTWPFVENEHFTVEAINDQPQTDVQVTFTQYHPLCNTICAEINPWCLFVNQLGMTVLIKMDSDKVCTVANNSVIVPPNLTNSTFQLGLVDEETNEEFYSTPLQLTDHEWHFQSLMPTVQGMVPLEGVCNNQILFHSTHVCYFTIKTKNENGMRIMNVLPTLILTNKTSKPLNVAPMSLQDSKQDLEMVDFLPQSYQVNESSPLLYWQIPGKAPKQEKGQFQGKMT